MGAGPFQVEIGLRACAPLNPGYDAGVEHELGVVRGQVIAGVRKARRSVKEMGGLADYRNTLSGSVETCW